MNNPRSSRTSTVSAFSLIDFIDRFHGNDEAVRQEFFRIKYPNGFVCSECGNSKYHYLENRSVYQCTHCCHQESLIAHTAFHGCKLGLYKILLAMFLFVTSQNGVSGTQLSYNLGINVNSARLLLRKLRTITEHANRSVILKDMVDVDGGSLGGVDRGHKRGRGSKKQGILVAQELEGGRYPGRVQIVPCKSENGAEIVAFVTRYIKAGSKLHSDKGTGFEVLSQHYKDADGNEILGRNGKPIAKYDYTIKQELSNKTTNPMKWLHTLVSNLKSELLGVYHGIPMKFLKLYLAEYIWRYNQRTIRSSLHKVHMILHEAYKLNPLYQKDIKARFV